MGGLFFDLFGEFENDSFGAVDVAELVDVFVGLDFAEGGVAFLFEGGDEFVDAFDLDGDVAEAEGVCGGWMGILMVCGVMEFDDFEV